MPITEDTLTSWAKGPGDTEEEKCERAIRAVRTAISKYTPLSELNPSVFLQGSYRNKTNVRQNSDVDICVQLDGTFYPEYPAGANDSTFGNAPAQITFRDYKVLVGAALGKTFGKAAVTRGDKAFKVHENTYRIDSDVVATFEHRRYTLRPDGSASFLTGIGFYTDSGRWIINWPEQNYRNGLAKHERTQRRYRKVVRMLKRLRDVMQQESVAASKDVASCLIEALVWNAPDDHFGHATYRQDLRAVMAHCFNNTMTDVDCAEWGEVNELKYLFRSAQPWNRTRAHAFLNAGWNRVGFE
jgi:hypothetical protein